MDTRVAVISIIVEDNNSIETIRRVLSLHCALSLFLLAL